jgi:uncharacterized membrane protein
MTREAPHQLDGMGYMGYSKYNEGGAEMDLSVDYRAIRWMQDNITGSPVIVEANTPEYRWGSRYSIYTGLPGVVGWNWHQRQQRAILPSDLVTRRVEEIRQFYTNGNRQQTEAFLKRYGVSYIILGQLEKIVYGGTGLEKFPLWENDLWHEVYREGDTAIYKVID